MADVELLPCGECGMPCRAGEYHPFAACLMFKACHNSETVRANLAPLQAEIEALRAEVAAWRELSDHVRVGACAAIWPDRYADARTRDVAAALKRAARMEEALALLPDEIVMVEHNPYEGPLMFCCGQRVTSGGLHDLLINHGKKCWYARMRALRDHDQEAAMREESKV